MIYIYIYINYNVLQCQKNNFYDIKDKLILSYSLKYIIRLILIPKLNSFNFDNVKSTDFNGSLRMKMCHRISLAYRGKFYTSFSLIINF